MKMFYFNFILSVALTTWIYTHNGTPDGDWCIWVAKRGLFCENSGWWEGGDGEGDQTMIVVI